ncbi:MAG: prolyl oligopeptidase family serine peptidase [Sciscionella sp.]
MGQDIVRLLGARTWRAFDVDDSGRVLAGSDASGTVQLVELDAEGQRPLTALPGPCSGRYLPGERTVVVAEEDGNERGQLFLLPLDPPAGLHPLVHDAEQHAVLTDVLPGRIVYRTDADVVIRNVLTGEEETVYDGGGMVTEAAVSPSARYVALSRPGTAALSDQLLLVDTMPATEDEHVLALTGENEQARHTRLGWISDDALLVCTNRGREFTGIARFEMASGEWHWLVTDELHDLLGWASPDGKVVLVMTNVDGVMTLALHDSDTGALLRQIDTPLDGWTGFPLPAWSPNSRFVTLTFSAPTVPADVLLIDLETAKLHQLTDSAADLAREDLVAPQRHQVSTPDGTAIPCCSYSPPSAAQLGSSVLMLHGGPESQAVQRFDPVVQALVGAGHTVLLPNVRGSFGYGKSWYSADDVLGDLAALHEWLAAGGLDPSRVALWARSYGPPSGVDSIVAPLPLIHGANGPRVSLSDVERLAEALRGRGTECVLLTYPDEGHGLAKRANRLDAYQRALGFVAERLR